MCALSRGQVWFLVIAAVLVASACQLGLVSDVWAPSRDPPSGKLKIAIYFAQVSRCVACGC